MDWVCIGPAFGCMYRICPFDLFLTSQKQCYDTHLVIGNQAPVLTIVALLIGTYTLSRSWDGSGNRNRYTWPFRSI